MDSGPASGQYRLCCGTLQEVSVFVGGAAQLPENGAEPGHQARGEKSKGCYVRGLIMTFKVKRTKCNWTGRKVLKARHEKNNYTIIYSFLHLN